MSIPAGAASSAGSSTTSSYFGGGGAFITFPANGELVKSIALDNCLMAFSMTGSTCFNIPNLLSKS